jgi:hypothetical protein
MENEHNGKDQISTRSLKQPVWILDDIFSDLFLFQLAMENILLLLSYSLTSYVTNTKKDDRKTKTTYRNDWTET